MEHLQILENLMGTTCACGNARRARMPYCMLCFYRLPFPIRFSLYKPIGKGYEEAFATAQEWHAENGKKKGAAG